MPKSMFCYTAKLFRTQPPTNEEVTCSWSEAETSGERGALIILFVYKSNGFPLKFGWRRLVEKNKNKNKPGTEPFKLLAAQTFQRFQCYVEIKQAKIRVAPQFWFTRRMFFLSLEMRNVQPHIIILSRAKLKARHSATELASYGAFWPSEPGYF